MKTKVANIDKNVSKEDLADRGMSVENLVGTLDLGHEFDLVSLSGYLDNNEYEPEASPFLVYRPKTEKGTILIPTNGQVSFVGCKEKDQMIQLAHHLINELSPIVSGEFPSPNEIEIQNIVIRGSINHELDLPPIVVLLGMEYAEYEPEQFPGVIYRPDSGETILIFGSGKFMVTGVNSYSQALSAANKLIDKFSKAGVPMNI